MATRTAGQLAGTIKQMIKMDLAELGENASTQNSFIYDYLSYSMHKWSRLAYNVSTSDVLTISADGYVTFKYLTSDITDMYEPLRILDSAGRDADQRTSFTDPEGWWKESANSQIHVKGLTGNYTCQYIRYPEWIAAEGQTPEWPPNSYMALIYDTMGLILESKGYQDESNNYYSIAQRHMPGMVQANINARGTPGGKPPSYNDIIELRG